MQDEPDVKAENAEDKDDGEDDSFGDFADGSGDDENKQSTAAFDTVAAYDNALLQAPIASTPALSTPSVFPQTQELDDPFASLDNSDTNVEEDNADVVVENTENDAAIDNEDDDFGDFADCEPNISNDVKHETEIEYDAQVNEFPEDPFSGMDNGNNAVEKPDINESATHANAPVDNGLMSFKDPVDADNEAVIKLTSDPFGGENNENAAGNEDMIDDIKDDDFGDFTEFENEKLEENEISDNNIQEGANEDIMSEVTNKDDEMTSTIESVNVEDNATVPETTAESEHNQFQTAIDEKDESPLQKSEENQMVDDDDDDDDDDDFGDFGTFNEGETNEPDQDETFENQFATKADSVIQVTFRSFGFTKTTKIDSGAVAYNPVSIEKLMVSWRMHRNIFVWENNYVNTLLFSKSNILTL